MTVEKEIIYIDLDETIFKYIEHLNNMKEKHPKQPYPQSVVHFFYDLEPIDDAIEVVKWLFSRDEFKVFFLTAPSVENPLCYTEKRLSLDKHFGPEIGSRMHISTEKNLSIGEYLIDDCQEGKGQDKFIGKLIHFGGEEFPDWKSIKKFFEQIILNKA